MLLRVLFMDAKMGVIYERKATFGRFFGGAATGRRSTPDCRLPTGVRTQYLQGSLASFSDL